MVTTITISAPLLAVALGMLAAYFASRLRADQRVLAWQACRAEEDRAQAAADLVLARAELERIREKHYAHPTVAMLEDLASVLLDIDTETAQYVRYIRGRLQNADQIMAAGRAGPHAYTQTDTTNRPPRPGARVHAWKM